MDFEFVEADGIRKGKYTLGNSILKNVVDLVNQGGARMMNPFSVTAFTEA